VRGRTTKFRGQQMATFRFSEKEKEHILYDLDAMIKNAKLKSISE
jgi:hypothetical protein